MIKKSYGILMSRHKISDSISLFQPICLISGSDTGEEFETDFKYCYPYVTDSNFFMMQENGLSVGYIISEEELLNCYQGISLEDAKMGYFSSIDDNIHIGYYKKTLDEVDLKSYNSEMLFSALADLESDLSIGNEETPSSTSISKTEEMAQEILPIPISEFQKLLFIPNDKTLREVLENIKLQYEEGCVPVVVNLEEDKIYPTLNSQTMNGSKILSFFSRICDRMMNASSLEQISKLETNVKKGLMQVVLRLDTYGGSEIAIQVSEETIYRILDEISLITTSRDLSVIKEEVSDLYKREQTPLAQVALLYDEFDRKLGEQLNEEKNHQNGISSPKERRELRGKRISSMAKKDGSMGLSARDMKSFFDTRIAGQEDAKKTIIAAVVMNSLSLDPNDRISCFLVGPPGSGKTLIAETLGEYLDIPYEIIDSTQLTSPGYVGRDIEDSLARLLRKAGGDLEKAERGIVVFNELDKKGSDKKSDISGQGVLNCLLSFFEGTTYQVQSGKDKIDFNTSRLTIFATGACADVAKAKLQKEGLGLYKKTTIGFGRELSDTKESEDFEYPKLEPEDFSKYGGIPPEIIGRITTICQLSGHTVESLKFILTNIETSALVLLQNLLFRIGISLSWEEGYLEAVANKAIQLKTGARSLKSTVEQSVKEARWQVLTHPEKYSGILLTAECVENPLACKLIDKQGRAYSVEEIVMEEQNEVEKVKKIGVME